MDLLVSLSKLFQDTGFASAFSLVTIVFVASFAHTFKDHKHSLMAALIFGGSAVLLAIGLNR